MELRSVLFRCHFLLRDFGLGWKIQRTRVHDLVSETHGLEPHHQSSGLNRGQMLTGFQDDLRKLVFPDEGHWVLGALNSKRWHESVFAWMNKYL